MFGYSRSIAQELVSCGAVVVAESAANRDEYPELERAVRYFEEDSADAMLKAIDAALHAAGAHKNLADDAAAKNLEGSDDSAKNPEAKDISVKNPARGAKSHAARAAAAVAASQRRFAFLLERFLIGVGFLPLANATTLDPSSLHLPALLALPPSAAALAAAAATAKPTKAAAPTPSPAPTRGSMSPPPPPLPPSLANLEYVLMSAPEHYQVRCFIW